MLKMVVSDGCHSGVSIGSGQLRALIRRRGGGAQDGRRSLLQNAGGFLAARRPTDTDNVNVENKAIRMEAHINVDGESKLENCYWFYNTMQKVENALEMGVFEDNELEYRFIRCCTSLSVSIRE
ncbi:hypothetical protein CASFOL_040320 [Castilleja foliolosa]|uniref:Uncharacterized protein n=1 Tax=Castilleja foliolosa TaxID=1961234 RepID=A0ABD3BF47_9LAMI